MSEVARDGGGLQEERGARHGADGVIGDVLEGEVGMSRRGLNAPVAAPTGRSPARPLACGSARVPGPSVQVGGR